VVNGTTYLFWRDLSVRQNALGIYVHWYSMDGPTWHAGPASRDPIGDATDGARRVALDWPSFGDISWSDDGRSWHAVAHHAWTDQTASRESVVLPAGVLILTTPDRSGSAANAQTDVQLLVATVGP